MRHSGAFPKHATPKVNVVQAHMVDTEKLRQAAAAYEVAVQLFSARFRGSGKPFIAHLVGTASIVATLHVPIEAVNASLLHAAYDQGDLGTGSWRRVSGRRRARLRGWVGPRVEQLVAAYALLPWNDDSVRGLLDRHDPLTEKERFVLLMRLANELEDHLDLGILHCGDAKQARAVASELTTQLAQQLGYGGLAAQLDEAYRACQEADPPTALASGGRPFSYTVLPASCRRRLPAALRHFAFRTLRRITYLRKLHAKLTGRAARHGRRGSLRDG